MNEALSQSLSLVSDLLLASVVKRASASDADRLGFHPSRAVQMSRLSLGNKVSQNENENDNERAVSANIGTMFLSLVVPASAGVLVLVAVTKSTIKLGNNETETSSDWI